MRTMLGTAKADITPPSAVPLAGFASRREPLEGVSRPIYVRVWLFGTADEAGRQGNKALLIQADLIWWGQEYVDAWKAGIEERWGIAPERIFFHASHSHGGPQTTGRFSPLLGLPDSAYIDYLHGVVMSAVAQAHDHVEPVALEIGEGVCDGIGVNRRKIVDGKAVFAPNPDGPADETVTVVRCTTEDGRTKGVLFHFTCHPTTTDDNRVTSEYCGVAMERLDERWGDGVACFLQGCCGDIRPALHRDGQFYKGDETDVERNGARLAQCVEGILSRPMRGLSAAAIEGDLLRTDLPFRELPDAERLQPDPGDNEAVAVWKEMMLSEQHKPESVAGLYVQILRLAEGFALLGMNGEMVVEYGLRIRSRSGGRVLPLGYSNGMIGYVPVDRQLGEGGYEGETSGYVFGYPSAFAPGVERRVELALQTMLESLPLG